MRQISRFRPSIVWDVFDGDDYIEEFAEIMESLVDVQFEIRHLSTKVSNKESKLFFEPNLN